MMRMRVLFLGRQQFMKYLKNALIFKNLMMNTGLLNACTVNNDKNVGPPVNYEKGCP